MSSIDLSTAKTPTWCPGCYNFQVLVGVKKVLEEKISSGKIRKENLTIAAGIGCHARIFDYIDAPGIHTIHGRVLPSCLGMKIGNPNLTIFGFSGDGDAYSEGMEHLVHTARLNPDIKYFVHNNQTFALTVGQHTPTTERGYKSKSNLEGVKIKPLNPIMIMLSSGASFVARVFADVKQIELITKEAMKHKGFAFIEIITPCLIFHKHTLDYKEKTYSLEEAGHNKNNFLEAIEKAQEFDYDIISKNTKIPVGIFYQEEKPVFEEQFEQLKELKKKGIGWRDIER
ncbi:MAG: thiamine pyrophosphate-dependent enzyme [archaeon]